jgi:hypothetical protein
VHNDAEKLAKRTVFVRFGHENDRKTAETSSETAIYCNIGGVFTFDAIQWYIDG